VDDPRGTVAESSHVGAEVGFAILTPVNDFISHRFAVMLKPSFGFGYRLDGPTDTKRTMYTWSVGVHVPTEFLSFR
jgi:hypothetical protein